MGLIMRIGVKVHLIRLQRMILNMLSGTAAGETATPKDAYMRIMWNRCAGTRRTPGEAFCPELQSLSWHVKVFLAFFLTTGRSLSNLFMLSPTSSRRLLHQVAYTTTARSAMSLNTLSS